MTLTLFFYGSLCDAEVRGLVLGPEAAGTTSCRAVLHDHVLRPVVGEDYPTVVPQAGSEAPGLVVEGLSEEALRRLRYFEDDGDFHLRAVEVVTDAGPVSAQVFENHRQTADPDVVWTLSAWHATAQPAFVEATRELMAHYGTLRAETVDGVWPGVRQRAYAKAAGKVERRPATFSTTLRAGDVEIDEWRHDHLSFFSMESVRMSHRRHGGGRTRSYERSVLVTGDGATVVPYDAVSDRVLLIEQLRAGALARRDDAPWLIEPVAGFIDSTEGPEAAARREAQEEAGLTLGRMERVAAAYPTPGSNSLLLYSYVGEADLTEAGGIYGLAEEMEDIRAFVLPFEEAMAGVASGEINTGPLVMTLYWLALNRDRLRVAWADRAG
ncbi:MAG: NUDIX domain-containing protein [Pseudomonadota bacterium]